MRIAYLAQSYPPMISGAAIFARQIAEGMAQRGHQILVIAASDKPYAYIVEKENLRILFVQSFHNPMRVRQRFLVYPRYAVLKALQEFGPDVIHSHDVLQIGMLGLEYASRLHIPVTVTAHQLPWFVASYLPENLKSCAENILWLYARWMLRKYTYIIAPTPSITDTILQNTRIQAHTISYGLNIKTFSPQFSKICCLATRQKWDLPADAPLLLHVGRLDIDKHVDRVIAESATVIHNTNAHLLIVGDGIQKPALMKQCNVLGIAERVHFTGYISNQSELADIYRIAGLLITTSEIETQGIVLLEAAASGLPIVALRATCIPEIVHDQVNGYLAEPNTEGVIGELVFRILNNPAIARSMSIESRRIAEKHNMQKTFDEHEKLYQQIRTGFDLEYAKAAKNLPDKKFTKQSSAKSSVNR